MQNIIYKILGSNFEGFGFKKLQILGCYTCTARCKDYACSHAAPQVGLLLCVVPHLSLSLDNLNDAMCSVSLHHSIFFTTAFSSVVLDKKMIRWSHAIRAVVKTLLADEWRLCDEVFLNIEHLSSTMRASPTLPEVMSCTSLALRCGYFRHWRERARNSTACSTYTSRLLISNESPSW